MTPKWITPVALVALLIGGGAIVLGPPVLYAVAAAAAEAELTPEQRADEQATAEAIRAESQALLERCFWVFPVAGGLGFCGMIALILAWVSRPLGEDPLPPKPSAPPQ